MLLCGGQGGGYNFQSHDSGHGTGSENDSPHLTLNNVRYLATAPTMERPAAVLVPVQAGELGPRVNPEFFAVYQHQQASRRGGRPARSHSPYHTYMEVDGDPVYEEIERHEPRHQLLVSDVSDEDRKQSDMSRQSSQRTCSDNRPLIPYGAERRPARRRRRRPAARRSVRRVCGTLTRRRCTMTCADCTATARTWPWPC